MNPGNVRVSYGWQAIRLPSRLIAGELRRDGSPRHGTSREPRAHDSTHTSQIVTPCFSDASTSGRAGTNSCATCPLKPVSTIAFITAG